MTGIEKAIQKSGSASALGFALGVTHEESLRSHHKF